MIWPFTAGLTRLGIVMVVGGLWINLFDGSLDGLCWIVAVSYLVFGGINIFGMTGRRGWAHQR